MTSKLGGIRCRPVQANELIHDMEVRIESNIDKIQGYSIGNWIDTDGDGRYDTLEVETRELRGPRAWDSSGLPLHSDNKTVVKERIYLDKADSNILVNEITVIDSSLTRPWTVVKLLNG